MPDIRVKDIYSAGVVGAGGAGFPTHVKLSAEAKTVIVNAAECEPLLHKDKQLLVHRTEDVISGLASAMKLVGAERGIIAVKEKYSSVIETVKEKLQANMEVFPLSDTYPAGDEFILVYEVLSLVIPPGGIPINVGAVVMNAETSANVSTCLDSPVIEKYVSIAGAVENPCTIRAAIGIPLEKCLAQAGKILIDNPVYVSGGAMMGKICETLDAPVIKTTGAIIVLPADHVVVKNLSMDWKQTARIAKSACDQCSFCTELCPRYLLGHPVQPHLAMRSIGFNPSGKPDVPGSIFCCECNLCSMYSCPEGLNPRAVIAKSKADILAKGEKWANPPVNPDRAAMHMNNRKAPTKRLMRRLDLNRFNNVGPLRDELVVADKIAIAMSQHLGTPCEPSVKPGQKVKIGNVVGTPPIKDGKPALGAPVHASINGKVTDVSDGIVWIEK